MNTGSVLIGNHGFFFREGSSYTVPSSGTAGRSSKPGGADTGWIDMGVISQISVQHEREEKEVFAPVPGAMRLYDIIETKRQLTIKLSGQEMSPLMFELIFGALALTSSSTQYNPLEGITKKGWLKIQQYNQADAQWHTIDVWVALKVSGEITFGSDIVTADFEARVLHSIYNTGTIN